MDKRMTYGANGSHWEGCEDVHWDCKIAQLEAELARRDEQIAELTATTHSQAFRNAELSRFVWWVYQVYARNVQELTSGITEACIYETEEKAEKGKYGLPIRCWGYIRYLEEYTAGIYNGTYLDSETSTGVKDLPAGHWKSQACIATKRMLELTAFLRKIMLLGLLRGSPRLRNEALRILDGFEPSPSDVSTTQDVLTGVKTPESIENTNPDYYKGEVHELHFTEALRNLAKRNPADVSAIGVSVLIDHIEELEKEIARRDEIITRLKEDAERLAATYVVEVFPHEWVCRGGCHHWARFGEQIDHAPDCPITLHRVLMKELE